MTSSMLDQKPDDVEDTGVLSALHEALAESSDGIALIDSGMHFLYTNRTIEDLLGGNQGLLGRNAGEVFVEEDWLEDCCTVWFRWPN